MRHAIALLALVTLIAGCQQSGNAPRTIPLNELQKEAGFAELQGNDAKAIELWTEFVRRRPHDAMARHQLGVVLLRSGDSATAVEHLRVAHDLKPSRIDYLESLIEALYQNGQKDDLFLLLRDTMSEGGLAEGRMRYASYALRAGLVDEAEESLRIAAALEGTRSDKPHRLLAALAQQTGDADREIEAWRTVLWFNSSDPMANARLRALGVIPGPSLATPPKGMN